MKKLIFVALAMVAIVLTNCKKDDTEAPVVSFGNADSTVVTKDAGAAAFSVTVSGTATDNEELKSVVCMNGGTQVGKISEFTDKTSYAFSFVIADIPATAAVIVITVTATDAKDNVNSKEFKIIVKVNTPVGGEINTYTNLNMGGSASTYGSYLDAETGTVYNSSTVTANQAAVDIIFDLGAVWNSTTAGLFTAGTGTKFATTDMSAAFFSTMTDDQSMLPGAGLNTVAIAANQVVFFITGGGKKGYLKVNSLASASGNLSIDVKIQK